MPGQPRLGCPGGRVGKIVCVGLNYRDHALEAGMQPPAEPVLFMKAITALSGPNDPLHIPPGAQNRLGGGIWASSSAPAPPCGRGRCTAACGRLCAGQRCVRAHLPDRAWRPVGQRQSYDSFAPIGPWLVTTADAVADPHAIDLWLEVNGQRVQNGSTRNFIFGCPRWCRTSASS